MRVLVAYASKHGATAGIAERIGMELRCSGLEVDVLPIDSVLNVANYDAYVLGSAVYIGSWMKDALLFVHQYADTFVKRPTWLFSSGPLGDEPANGQDNDQHEAIKPKQVTELEEILRPREHRIFFGALDRSDFGLRERVIAAMPGSDKLLPEGDFRNWEEVDTWATNIAHQLPLARTAPIS